jgi:hypothetical protein
VSADLGFTIEAMVSADNGQGNQASMSAATGVVANATPSIVDLDGFESGSLSTNGPGLYSGTAGSSTISTGFAHGGEYANRVNSLNVNSGPNQSFADMGAGNPTSAVVRFAFMAAEFPTTAQSNVMEFDSPTGPPFTYCNLHLTTTGQLRADANGTDGATNVQLQLWHWYVINMRCDFSTTTQKVDWSVDGVVEPSATAAESVNTIQDWTWGPGAGTGNSDYYYDDLAVSSTANDFPLRSGKIDGLRPNGSPGTYDSPANPLNTQWADQTGAALNGNTYPFLADDPMTNTTQYASQLTNAPTSYAQWDMQDTPESATADAVMGTVGYHTGSGTPSAQTVAIRFDGTSDTIYSGSMSVGATLTFNSSMLAASALGWTPAEVDALKLRTGFQSTAGATDWDGLLLQADYPVGSMASSSSAPVITSPSGSLVHQGDVLSTSNGAWTGGTITYGYQWLRCNSAGGVCVPISGATSSTYTAQAADLGSTLRSLVVADNGNGRQVAPSAQTASVTTTPNVLFMTGMEMGVAASGGGSLWNTLSGGASASNTAARDGTYSLQTSTVGAQSLAGYNLSGTQPVGVMHLAFYMDTLPSATNPIAEFDDQGGANAAYLRFTLWPTGVLKADYSGAACAAPSSATFGTLTPGQWYTLDMRADMTPPSAAKIDWSVNGVPQTSLTSDCSTSVGANLTSFDMGIHGATTATFHFDDIVVTQTGTDYPIGDVQVLGMPVASEAGDVGPGAFQDDASGAISDPTSWQRIADPVWGGTTSFLRQTTVNTGDYLNFGLAPVSNTNKPFAARGYVAYHSSGGTPGGADNGTTQFTAGTSVTSVYSGNMTGAGISYKAAMLTAPTGGWTQANLNATTGQIGFSSSTNGGATYPSWDALMVEAAIPR